MKTKNTLTLLLITTLVFAQERPVHTYSIVAIDKETGEVHKAPYHFTTEEEAQKALDIMSIPPIAKKK